MAEKPCMLPLSQLTFKQRSVPKLLSGHPFDEVLPFLLT